jgi:hypothetical protein
MDFILGIRKLNVVSKEKALDEFTVQTESSGNINGIDTCIGLRHEHKCAKCRTLYPCYRNGGCNKDITSICDKCWEKFGG